MKNNQNHVHFQNTYLYNAKLQELNIVEDSSASKESKAPVPDHGRKQNLENAIRLQTGSPGVSTVAVKRKPRTQVAESLAKVISRYRYVTTISMNLRYLFID